MQRHAFAGKERLIGCVCNCENSILNAIIVIVYLKDRNSEFTAFKLRMQLISPTDISVGLHM